MKIVEFKVDDDLEIGAVSFVSSPATEIDFIYFNKEKPKPGLFATEFKFDISSQEKHEVEGVVMTSGKFIYRNDVGDGSDGYVYFSRDVVRKLKESYGFNRTITIEHMSNITGTAILLDSWLVEDDDNNITQWFTKYKIINDELWKAIKAGAIKGFSIELYGSV